MIKQIVRSELFLRMPSDPADPSDVEVARDLIDTLVSRREECAGLAANMIGVRRRVIAFFDGDVPRAMLNLRIVEAHGEYDAEEGCLSLDGTRHARRHRRIRVRYQNLDLVEREETFDGWCAQVIQHEIDHCDGVVI